nr:FAD-linked oxidase C-terminal domain-containing protein [Variovorax boronicumulans]
MGVSIALLLADPKDPAHVDLAEAVCARLAHRAFRRGGTCTGEHGVGLHKRPSLREEHGDDAVDHMVRIRRALDPNTNLDPGKVVAWTP